MLNIRVDKFIFDSPVSNKFITGETLYNGKYSLITFKLGIENKDKIIAWKDSNTDYKCFESCFIKVSNNQLSKALIVIFA